MQQTLDSLERRRWIKRTDHPTDRRQILFSPSAASGEKALRRRAANNARRGSSARSASSPSAERKTLSDALGLLERFVQTNP